MACYWAKHRQTRLLQRCQIPLAYPSSWQLAKQILIYAVPICLGSIVVPIISIVDTFTIPRLIKLQGWNEDATMHLFGVYNRGLPLVQLVAMLASSVSVALVPVISEAKIRGDWPAIRLRSELAIRATWILGLASSAGLAALAPSINVMLYTNREGTAAMTIISLIALLSSLNIISGSLLQGMGCVTAPVRNLFIASAVKIGLNIILIPSLGILGAALSAVFAFASAAALNLRELVHRTDMRISLNCYAGRIGLSAGLMAVFLLVSQFWLMGAAERLPFNLAPHMVHTAITLMGIGIGTMIYGFLMFRLGAITEEDLAKVPNLEAKVRPLQKKNKYIS
jgi:O-antigen/teichoic acid export membrane protein